MMSRKYIILIVLVMLTLVTGYVIWQMPAKKKYDELVASDVGLSNVKIADEQFLAEVITSWEIRASSCPDEAMTAALKLVGEEKTVQGIVNLYTHDPKPFSFIDLARNKREALYVTTQSVITPITVDDTIHVGDGILYLRIKENIVEVFGDTDEGIKSTIYFRQQVTSAKIWM